jgi:hypothetical protein
VNRDSAVGISNRYRLQGSGIDFLWGRDPSRTALGSTQDLYNWYNVLTTVKAGRTWRWIPTISSAKIKERIELHLYSKSEKKTLSHSTNIYTDCPLSHNCNLRLNIATCLITCNSAQTAVSHDVTMSCLFVYFIHLVSDGGHYWWRTAQTWTVINDYSRGAGRWQRSTWQEMSKYFWGRDKLKLKWLSSSNRQGSTVRGNGAQEQAVEHSNTQGSTVTGSGAH